MGKSNMKIKELTGKNYLVIFDNNTDVAEAKAAFDELVAEFPDKKFVGMFNNIFVREVSKHEVEYLIKSLKALLVD